LVSFIEAQGIELSFTEKITPALGMSYGGKIAILPGQSEAEEFSTLVHELAHEMALVRVPSRLSLIENRLHLV
jgi:hypothetical protein